MQLLHLWHCRHHRDHHHHCWHHHYRHCQRSYQSPMITKLLSRSQRCASVRCVEYAASGAECIRHVRTMDNRSSFPANNTDKSSPNSVHIFSKVTLSFQARSNYFPHRFIHFLQEIVESTFPSSYSKSTIFITISSILNQVM